MRTIVIELRVDFDDKAKDKILLKAAREAAKILFTTATLISDKRKPQISIQSGDFFSANEEISLDDDGEDEGGDQN